MVMKTDCTKERRLSWTDDQSRDSYERRYCIKLIKHYSESVKCIKPEMVVSGTCFNDHCTWRLGPFLSGALRMNAFVN
jgi:hypothetical protein